MIRLLLADDHLLIRNGLKLILKENPNVEIIYETAKGEEVIDFLTNNPESIDVVLMDMNMPVLDGYEAVKRLRAKGLVMPILALTASPAPQDKQRALEAGCNSYLLKPIAIDELLSRVCEYLSEEASHV